MVFAIKINWRKQSARFALALSSKVIAVLIGFGTLVNLSTFEKNSELQIFRLTLLFVISLGLFFKTYKYFTKYY